MAIITALSGVATVIALPFIIAGNLITAYEGYNKHFSKRTPQAATEAAHDAADGPDDLSPSLKPDDPGVLLQLWRRVTHVAKKPAKNTTGDAEHAAEESQNEDIPMEPMNRAT